MGHKALQSSKHIRLVHPGLFSVVGLTCITFVQGRLRSVYITRLICYTVLTTSKTAGRLQLRLSRNFNCPAWPHESTCRHSPGR